MKKGLKYPPRDSTLPKLDALMAYIAKYRYADNLHRPPSTREMAAESDCSQAEICRRLGILERQGKITWTPGVSRSVIPALDDKVNKMFVEMYQQQHIDDNTLKNYQRYQELIAQSFGVPENLIHTTIADTDSE